MSAPAAGKGTPADRRQHPRKNIIESQLVTVDLAADDEARRRGIVIDVSEGGLAVQSFLPLQPGSASPVQFEIPGWPEPFKATGLVAWVGQGGRAGIRFIDVPPAAREVLRQWLGRDSRRSPAAAEASEPQTAPSSPNDELDLDGALQLVADRARSIASATGVAVALGDSNGMDCRFSAGNAPDVGARLSPDAGLSGLCLRSGELVYCPDTQDDPRVDPEVARQLNLRSILIVPVFVLGQLTGVLELLSAYPHAFEARHITRLKRIAELLGATIEENAKKDPPEQEPIPELSSSPALAQTAQPEVKESEPMAEEIRALSEAAQPVQESDSHSPSATFNQGPKTELARSAVAAYSVASDEDEAIEAADLVEYPDEIQDEALSFEDSELADYEDQELIAAELEERLAEVEEELHAGMDTLPAVVNEAPPAIQTAPPLSTASAPEPPQTQEPPAAPLPVEVERAMAAAAVPPQDLQSETGEEAAESIDAVSQAELQAKEGKRKSRAGRTRAKASNVPDTSEVAEALPSAAASQNVDSALKAVPPAASVSRPVKEDSVPSQATVPSATAPVIASPVTGVVDGNATGMPPVMKPRKRSQPKLECRIGPIFLGATVPNSDGGEVILSAIITEEGNVESVKVVSGPRNLSTAASDIVREWHCTPYELNGQAVCVQATITMRFRPSK